MVVIFALMSPTGVILGTFMPESVVATSIFYCISSGFLILN